MRFALFAVSFWMSTGWMALAVAQESADADMASATDAPAPQLPPDSLVIPPQPPEELEEGMVFEANAARRLDAWLRFRANRARFGRILGGIVSLVLGAFALGGTIAALTLDDSGMALSFGGLGALVTALEIGSGIAMLAMPLADEDRLERWNALRAVGTYDVDVGAFAGELRGEAMAARTMRHVLAATSFSLGAGGVAALVVALAVDADPLAKSLGAIMGGAFAVVGTMTGMLSLLVTSDAEDVWDSFEHGLAPRDPESLTLGFAPFVAPTGAGGAARAHF